MLVPKELRLGIVGHAAVDAKFPHLRFVLEDGRLVRIAAGGEWIDVRTLEPVRYSKANAVIPARLWPHAADKSCGGGGPNSVMGAMRGDSAIPVRYVESTRPDDVVRRALAFPTVEFRSLDLRPTPTNAVLGSPADKLILKSPIGDTLAFDTVHFTILDWLSDCVWVLVNSPKDEQILEHLVAKVRVGATRLCLVFTGSPSSVFLWSKALPAASAVIGSSDEIPAVMRWGPRPGLAGALRTLLEVRAQAPGAMVLITVGPDGALVSEAVGGPVFRVRLRCGIWRQVQQLVREDPTRLSGVGDAFAGAAAAQLVSGRSCVGSLDPLPPAFAACVAGSAAAARWLGFGGALRASDFLFEPAGGPAAMAA